MKKQIFTLSIILSVIVVWAQEPGGIHPSLAGKGIVITPLSTADNEANSMAIQKDGKIVVAGYSNTDFAIVRYNVDGTLDPGFGKKGIVKTSLHCGDEHTSAVAIQPDGKIVVAGSTNNGTANDFAVIRYNENGVLDPSFGNGIEKVKRKKTERSLVSVISVIVATLRPMFYHQTLLRNGWLM